MKTTMEFAHKLHRHFKDNAPRKTGNLADKAIHPGTRFSATKVGITIDLDDAPYAVYLNDGFIHPRTGKLVTKHKGWIPKLTTEFANQLAAELGGRIVYVGKKGGR